MHKCKLIFLTLSFRPQSSVHLSLFYQVTKVTGIIELFFVKKKIPPSRRVKYVMDGWMDKSVRDVCISHQSDWIYYKQPIKFLVVKVNGMWEDLWEDLIWAFRFETALSSTEVRTFVIQICCTTKWVQAQSRMDRSCGEPLPDVHRFLVHPYRFLVHW